MSINELVHLLEVLHKYGVNEYSSDGITLKLGTMPSEDVPESQPIKTEADKIFDRVNPNYRRLLEPTQ